MNPILVHHNYNIYLNYFIAQSQRYIFIYSKSFLHITPSVILSLPWKLMASFMEQLKHPAKRKTEYEIYVFHESRFCRSLFVIFN